MRSNLAKIARRVSSYEIKMHADTRPGKKLLVLDIGARQSICGGARLYCSFAPALLWPLISCPAADYTVYDHRSPAENFEQVSLRLEIVKAIEMERIRCLTRLPRS